MTYHTVFDISERFPEAAIGVVAFLGAVVILALALWQSGRAFLRTMSWLWLAVGGVLWGALGIHNIGGPAGLLFGGVLAGLALILAFLAWTDADLRFGEGYHRVRPVAPFAAAVLLLVTGLVGCQQLSAFDLGRQLADADATVVTGPVEDAGGGNWSWECFTVGRHQYCYADSPSYVGFHQSASNGGPIRNGLQIRVSSIGDVIVRLEVADGQ